MKIFVLIFSFIFIVPMSYSKEKLLTLIRSFPKNDSTIGNDYLVHPHDLDVMNEFIIVCDLEENCVKIFNNKGQFINRIGKSGQGPGDIGVAFKASVDSENSLIYLLDPANSRMSVFRETGEYVKLITTLQTPSNLFFDNGRIYSSGYNETDGTLFHIYGRDGNVIGQFEKLFDENIPKNRFTSTLYNQLSMASDGENIYALFEYIPYICIYSREGKIVNRIKLKYDKITDRYSRNVQAVKNGIENGNLKIFSWNNGGVLYNKQAYYLTNYASGYDETILVFNLKGEFVEEIVFEDEQSDKSYYKLAAIVDNEYIFYDWSNGQVIIYREK